jgi:hypothetical protein
MARFSLSVLFSIAVGLALAPRADAQLEVRMPECTARDVDVSLVRELLAIELEGSGLEIAIDPSICDAARTAIAFDVSEPATGRAGHDEVVLAASDERDPASAARAIALAIAERAPRVLTRPPEPDPEPPPAESRPPIADRAAALAAPSPSPSPSPSPAALPATLGLGLRGRTAPVLPSWALGLRIDVGASFDPTWSIRGELFGTWTRATATEGDVDAVVAAGALVFSGTLLRTSAYELALGARGEGGVLVAMGWSGAASTGPATFHPWITAGAQLDGVWWLSSSIAVVVDVAVSGVLWGTRLSTWPSGTQIDLSYVLLDLGAGLRIAL